MTKGTPRVSFFFFNDTATTEIYTLSLHDALPISQPAQAALQGHGQHQEQRQACGQGQRQRESDRKSTRLNSSHGYISYAVFCLKKKKKTGNHYQSCPPDHPVYAGPWCTHSLTRIS